MSAKTSVIICAYNYARFLPRCLESVFSQSQPADEIILVDDGSTDETADVVKRFPPVRYIRQENAGKAAAFNRGFRESQGDLICHLDADDYWLPRKLQRVTETLAACDAGGMLHEAVYVDGDDKYLYGSEILMKDSSSARRFSFQDLLLMCFIYRPPNAISANLGVSNTICFRREAVADCFPLPADLGLAVDGALMFSTARFGLLCLFEKLSAYRHHGKNGFVSTPGSMEYQSRLYKWAPAIPGVTPRDRKLLRTLVLEIDAHSAGHNRRDPAGNAWGAATIIPALIRLGLVPHWKHLVLPIGSLVGWRRIRGNVHPGDFAGKL
jgi:glycosyltransferase involved in cell wall biosynthesis